MILTIAIAYAVAPVLGDSRLPHRFWRKVRLADGGCWTWTAAKTQGGYGHFWLCGKVQAAHRVSYLSLVGEIPGGLQLDHLCRNRACVNPAHLEPVTASVNNRRGIGPALLSARKRAVTHCPQGHAYSVENTRYGKTGRHCVACCRDSSRKAHARRREAARNVRASA